MLDLIRRIQEHAPADSILIVEAEEPFDFDVVRNAQSIAGNAGDWDVRAYRPAVVGIWQAN